jgi:hypothetical protein
MACSPLHNCYWRQTDRSFSQKKKIFWICNRHFTLCAVSILSIDSWYSTLIVLPCLVCSHPHWQQRQRFRYTHLEGSWWSHRKCSFPVSPTRECMHILKVWEAALLKPLDQGIIQPFKACFRLALFTAVVNSERNVPENSYTREYGLQYRIDFAKYKFNEN